MDSNEKILASDTDGMASYELLVNNIDGDRQTLSKAVENLHRVDTSGQFAASAARFLAAVSREQFADLIDTLLKQVIEKDRDKAYLPDLLPCIWGADYTEHINELRETDDNFRRIYKRVHPSSAL